MDELSWIEISKNKLLSNVRALRQTIGSKILLAPCIKANAYGHGMVLVSKIIKPYIDCFCVDSIKEAQILQENNIQKPILIIGYVLKKDLPYIYQLENISLTVYNNETLNELYCLSKKYNQPAKIHLKIDTGMGRQGILPQEALTLAKKISQTKCLKLEGMATHFATADELKNPAYFLAQLNLFKKIKQQLETKLKQKIIFHAANSAAALCYGDAHFDLVRPGIALYGYYPSPEVKTLCQKKNLELEPVLSLKTKIAQIKEVSQGSCVSYNCTHITQRKTRLTVLPIGYFDGLPRKLSGKARVLISGQRAKILGRMCMNITVVDITDIADVKVEDEAVIIGQQKNQQITAYELAIHAETINYEILTNLKGSLPRYVIN